jgi:uncharacterized protein (DUF2236 family)
MADRRSASHRPVSPEDADRLRAALGARPLDVARSLFGSDSASARINREAVLLLGGGRALLLQVAHPLVAAGVAAHSRFRAQPVERLRRTLDLMLTIVFADAARAIHAVRQIEHVHARVRGALDTAVGPFPRGTPYDASDPSLLFWVHATLVDSAMVAYQRFVAPLTLAMRAAYYEESKISARLLGISEPCIPPTLAEFEQYVAEMVQGDVLSVGAAAREVAASILRPPVPLGLRPAFAIAALPTIGLLPVPVRERYGFPWSRAHEFALSALARVIRGALPLLPDYVRAMPHARRGKA